MPSLQLRGQDLTGKVAIVTGASRGIGRAIAINPGSRGCNILGTCSNSNSLPLFDSLDENIGTLYKETKREPTSRVIDLVADIFSSNCAQTIFPCISQNFSRRIDIFVNSAADPMPGVIGKLTVDEIQQSLLGNIQTPVLIVDKLVERKMFQLNSRIVYISSVRSRQPWSGQLMYAAGKSAGESLCRTWAEAFGGKEEKFSFMAGTTANSVTVGVTETDGVMKMLARGNREVQATIHSTSNSTTI